MVFKNLLRKHRKSNEKSKKNKSVEILDSNSSIFRTDKTSLKYNGLLGPALAPTFSAESDVSVSSSFALFENSTPYKKKNEFRCSVRDQEILQLKRSVQDLEMAHSAELAEAQETIWQNTAQVKQTQNQLHQTESHLEETSRQLVKAELKCAIAQEELVEVKEDLQSVTAALMTTQEALHEKEVEYSALQHLAQFGKGFAGLF